VWQEESEPVAMDVATADEKHISKKPLLSDVPRVLMEEGLQTRCVVFHGVVRSPRLLS